MITAVTITQHAPMIMALTFVFAKMDSQEMALIVQVTDQDFIYMTLFTNFVREEFQLSNMIFINVQQQLLTLATDENCSKVVDLLFAVTNLVGH